MNAVGRRLEEAEKRIAELKKDNEYLREMIYLLGLNYGFDPELTEIVHEDESDIWESYVVECDGSIDHEFIVKSFNDLIKKGIKE